MKSYKQYMEENGLGDIQPKSNSGNELLDELAELLRRNADRFTNIFNSILEKEDVDINEENDLKKLIGILGNLKNNPIEKKRKMRDPLDNVVNRPAMSGEGGSGDGGGE